MLPEGDTSEAYPLSATRNFGELRFTTTSEVKEPVLMLPLDELAPSDTRLIKVDVEGFEPEVLKGAQAFLRAARPLGVETETSFTVSPVLQRTHFVAVSDQLIEHRLLVHDLAFARAPCPA